VILVSHTRQLLNQIFKTVSGSVIFCRIQMPDHRICDTTLFFLLSPPCNEPWIWLKFLIDLLIPKILSEHLKIQSFKNTINIRTFFYVIMFLGDFFFFLHLEFPIQINHRKWWFLLLFYKSLDFYFYFFILLSSYW
jgi:hypothetical protein